MKKEQKINHEFVNLMPEILEEGIIYISVDCSVAIHKCACGCGNEIVTPLSPSDWILIFDGNTVSIHPSIGNWVLPCRSHYWIERDTIQWAEDWTRYQIASVRAHDLRLENEKKSMFKLRVKKISLENLEDLEVPSYPEDITDTTIEMIVRHPDASRSQIHNNWLSKDIKQKLCQLHKPRLPSQGYHGKRKQGFQDRYNLPGDGKQSQSFRQRLILHIQNVLPKKFKRADSDIRNKISHMRHTKKRIESLGLL